MGRYYLFSICILTFFITPILADAGKSPWRPGLQLLDGSSGIKCQSHGVKVNIINGHSSVIVEQVYVNSTDEVQTGVFLLALPNSATITSFTYQYLGKQRSTQPFSTVNEEYSYGAAEMVYRLKENAFKWCAEKLVLQSILSPLLPKKKIIISIAYEERLTIRDKQAKYSYPLVFGQRSLQSEQFSFHANIKDSRGVSDLSLAGFSRKPSVKKCRSNTEANVTSSGHPSGDMIELSYIIPRDGPSLSVTTTQDDYSGELGCVSLVMPPAQSVEESSNTEVVAVIATTPEKLNPSDQKLLNEVFHKIKSRAKELNPSSFTEIKYNNSPSTTLESAIKRFSQTANNKTILFITDNTMKLTESHKYYLYGIMEKLAKNEIKLVLISVGNESYHRVAFRRFLNQMKYPEPIDIFTQWKMDQKVEQILYCISTPMLRNVELEGLPLRDSTVPPSKVIIVNRSYSKPWLWQGGIIEFAAQMGDKEPALVTMKYTLNGRRRETRMFPRYFFQGSKPNINFVQKMWARQLLNSFEASYREPQPFTELRKKLEKLYGFEQDRIRFEPMTEGHIGRFRCIEQICIDRYTSNPVSVNGGAGFTDVPGHHWAAPYVRELVQTGILQ